MLIDVHSHIGQLFTDDESADGEALCAMMRDGGVTHAVTFSIEGCLRNPTGSASSFQTSASLGSAGPAASVWRSGDGP
jgi:hypothetical protein